MRIKNVRKQNGIPVADSITITTCADKDCGCGSVWIMLHGQDEKCFAAACVPLETIPRLCRDLKTAMAASLLVKEHGGTA